MLRLIGTRLFHLRYGLIWHGAAPGVLHFRHEDEEDLRLPPYCIRQRVWYSTGHGCALQLAFSPLQISVKFMELHVLHGVCLQGILFDLTLVRPELAKELANECPPLPRSDMYNWANLRLTVLILEWSDH